MDVRPLLEAVRAHGNRRLGVGWCIDDADRVYEMVRVPGTDTPTGAYRRTDTTLGTLIGAVTDRRAAFSLWRDLTATRDMPSRLKAALRADVPCVPDGDRGVVAVRDGLLVLDVTAADGATARLVPYDDEAARAHRPRHYVDVDGAVALDGWARGRWQDVPTPHVDGILDGLRGGAAAREYAWALLGRALCGVRDNWCVVPRFSKAPGVGGPVGVSTLLSGMLAHVCAVRHVRGQMEPFDLGHVVRTADVLLWEAPRKEDGALVAAMARGAAMSVPVMCRRPLKCQWRVPVVLLYGGAGAAPPRRPAVAGADASVASFAFERGIGAPDPAYLRAFIHGGEAVPFLYKAYRAYGDLLARAGPDARPPSSPEGVALERLSGAG
jgi:hypothetical protein